MTRAGGLWVVLRKLVEAAATVFVIFTIAFLLVNLLKGDVVENYLNGQGAAYSRAQLDQLRAFYGYDQPLWIRYFSQLAGIVRGDFGYSLSKGDSVDALVASAAGQTAALAATSVVFVLALTFVIGFLATYERVPARIAAAARVLPTFFSVVPPSWLGIVVLTVFSIGLRVISLYPDGGIGSLVAPAVVVAVCIFSSTAQVYISQVRKVSAEPYVDVFRVAGVSPSRLYFRHVLANIWPPFLTVFGFTVALTFSGTVVTEIVFNRDGLGRLLLDAVTNNDITLIQGLIVIIAIVFVVINMLTDGIVGALNARESAHDPAGYEVLA